MSHKALPREASLALLGDGTAIKGTAQARASLYRQKCLKSNLMATDGCLCCLHLC